MFVPGDDNVIVLQLLTPGSPGGPVVEPQLQTNSLVEMSVQLLNPVSNEAGGAHDQGRPPPASPLGRKLGRSDREHLRFGRMLHCTGHWGRGCWFAWLSDQRCQETLGKRIDFLLWRRQTNVTVIVLGVGEDFGSLRSSTVFNIIWMID